MGFMKKRNIIFKCFIFLLFVLILAGCQKSIDVTRLEDTNGPIDIIYKDEELKEMSKWKNMSMGDLINDSANGDRAALYNLGMYYLLGEDVPINVNNANIFFARSASFGFAPALDKLATMYLKDASTVMLGLVYKNLVIAFGHKEFLKKYHELRDKNVQDTGGESLMNAVEEIAAQKMSAILKNQINLEKAVNKKEFCIRMKNITEGDDEYDKSYWLKLFMADKEIETKPWYFHIDQLEVNEDTRKFLRLTVEGFQKIPEITSNNISEHDIKNYLENNVPLLMETQEGQYKICESLRQLGSIPVIEKKALDKIMAAHEGKPILFDLEEAVYERVGSKVEKILKDFKTNIKYSPHRNVFKKDVKH